MEKPVLQHPEHVVPRPMPFPEPHQRNKYRWILWTFVGLVLVGVVYVGWRIVEAWEDILEQWLG
jgi:hypothetical protein